MALGDEGGKTSSVTGLNIRSGIANRRAGSSQNINNVGNENAVSRPDPRVMRIPSSVSDGAFGFYICHLGYKDIRRNDHRSLSMTFKSQALVSIYC